MEHNHGGLEDHFPLKKGWFVCSMLIFQGVKPEKSQEILGYNVKLSYDELGSGSVAGYYAVTGCKDFNNVEDRGCMQGVTQHKIIEAPCVEEHGAPFAQQGTQLSTDFREQNPPQIQISAWWFCVHNWWVNISSFQLVGCACRRSSRCPHLDQDTWYLHGGESMCATCKLHSDEKSATNICRLFWVCFQYYCCPTSKERETLAEDLSCWTGSTGNWTPDGMRKPEWCRYLFICGRCLS